MEDNPLMRFILFRLSEAEHVFVWTFQHALLDGRSFLIVLREVFGFYEATLRGEEAHFEARRPYRDYIEWLQKQDNSRSEAFWRKLLKGFTAPNQMRVERQQKEAPGLGEKHGEEQIRLDNSSLAISGQKQKNTA
jgi:NRPS condensation-like uncharacterized protein